MEDKTGDALERLSNRIVERRSEEKKSRIEKANEETSKRIRILQLAERHTPQKNGTYRASPPDGHQPDFFVSSVCDIPLKDDISLMDIAPFRLAKRYQRQAETMIFNVKGAEIEVRSDTKGMATIYDYDIVLMMISELTEQAQLWRDGKRPLPERKFAPSAYEIMKFCQRSTNGREYQALKAALDRLHGTKITIVSSDDEWRRAGGFNLIDGYSVLAKTKSGRIAQVSIGIPSWIYDGIVSRKKPTVLTYNRDYFQLDSGIARFIYRLARKVAGSTEAVWTIRDLHKLSGSQSSYKMFSHYVRHHANEDDLPDYHLEVKEGRRGPVLLMQRRPDSKQVDIEESLS